VVKLSGASLKRMPRRLLERWRMQRRRTTQRVPSIGVASGKGGTGKTFVTVNLGVVLARSLGKVQIFDTDLGLGNAHLHLGVKPEFHLNRFLEGRVELEDLLLESPYRVRLLPGGSGISRLAQLGTEELGLLSRAISRTLSDSQLLMIDSAAGISPQTLMFLQHTDYVLVVVTPSLPSLTDAYALIKCMILRRPRVRILVLVNRADNDEHALEAFSKLRDVSTRFLSFPVHYLGGVPEDRAVEPALVAKVPLVIRAPQSPAARGLRQAARRLARLLDDVDPGQAGFADSLRQSF